MILDLLGIYLMILSHEGVFMMIFDPLRDVFFRSTRDAFVAFDPLGMLF